jgi:hypothetical protein
MAKTNKRKHCQDDKIVIDLSQGDTISKHQLDLKNTRELTILIGMYPTNFVKLRYNLKVIIDNLTCMPVPRKITLVIEYPISRGDIDVYMKKIFQIIEICNELTHVSDLGFYFIYPTLDDEHNYTVYSLGAIQGFVKLMWAIKLSDKVWRFSFDAPLLKTGSWSCVGSLMIPFKYLPFIYSMLKYSLPDTIAKLILDYYMAHDYKLIDKVELEAILAFELDSWEKGKNLDFNDY